MTRHWVAIVLLSVVGVGLIGCSDPGSRSDLVRAKGKVLYKGQPLAGATVMFTPVEKGSPANGTTDSSGAFTLSTGGRPGATLGKHQVTVTKAAAGAAEAAKAMTPDDMKKMYMAKAKPPETKSEIPEKYASGKTSTLEATVDSDAAKNDFEFTLAD